MTAQSNRGGRVQTSAAAPLILPSGVLGMNGAAGANDRYVIGAIGVGNHGRGLIGRFAAYDDVSIAAVADVDLRRAERVAAEVEAGDVYQDYRRVLERDDIDAVIEATPDHWRALIGVHAAQAGKDIYGEKPASLTIREGRRLVEAVRNNGVVYQTGSQQRSMDANHEACMFVRNGRLGAIKQVIVANYSSPWYYGMAGEPVPPELDWDTWCGPVMPVPYTRTGVFLMSAGQGAEPGWLMIRDFSGGLMTTWGAHGLDQMQWALGMDESGPIEVWTEGEPFAPPTYTEPEDRDRGFELCTAPHVFMRYPGDIVMEFTGDSRERMGGGLIIGEKGSIAIDRGAYAFDPPELGEEPLEDPGVVLERSEHHYRNWLDCIRTRNRPIADVEIGHRSASVCHLANIARCVSEVTGETGQRMEWDPAAERFTNSAWGNHFLDRPRRQGYHLPEG